MNLFSRKPDEDSVPPSDYRALLPLGPSDADIRLGISLMARLSSDMSLDPIIRSEAGDACVLMIRALSSRHAFVAFGASEGQADA